MAEKDTPRKVIEQNLNPIPESETELSSQLITPQDGRARIGNSFREINKFKVHTHSSDRRDILDTWDLKTAITSDTRLSNITKLQEEYVQWTIKMEGYCLMFGLAKPASTASWLRSSIVEPGLGREMALRNNLNTIRNKSETVSLEEKPKARSILGFPLGGK